MEKGWLQQLNIIHKALMSGAFFFLLVVVVVKKGDLNFNFDDTLAAILVYAGLFFAIISPLIGRTLFKAKLEPIHPALPLEGKLFAYRGALILKLATWEGAIFFNAVAAFKTGHAANLALAGTLMFLFFFQMPARYAVAETLQLSREEEALL